MLMMMLMMLLMLLMLLMLIAMMLTVGAIPPGEPRLSVVRYRLATLLAMCWATSSSSRITASRCSMRSACPAFARLNVPTGAVW